MTNQELADFFDSIAQYYEHGYNDAKREAISDAIRGMSLERVRAAWKWYRENAERDLLPSLKQLLEACNERAAKFNNTTDIPVSAEDTTEELAAMTLLVNEILYWHTMGLSKYQPMMLDAGTFDLDSWRRNGKRSTWSPILDWALGVVAEVWHQGKAARIQAYKQCLQILCSQREKRSGNKDLPPVDFSGPVSTHDVSRPDTMGDA